MALLNSKQETIDCAHRMQVGMLLELDEARGLVQSNFGIEALDEILKASLHLHVTQKPGDDRAYILCSNFVSGGVLISKMKKLLADKKIETIVKAVPDSVSRHFSSQSLSKNKGGKASDSTMDSSVAIQHLEELLNDSTRMKAADTRVAINRQGTEVKYRIDGALVPARFDASLAEWGELIGRCIFSYLPKIQGNQSTGEFNPNDEVNATFTLIGRRWRAGLFPADCGPVISIRELGRTDDRVPTLEELGFSREQCLLIRDSTLSGNGLFLVTGPTGHGKSTTQSSIITEMNDGSRAIYTMEDPVERLIPGIYQATVEEENAKRTFERFGKQLLRQNPNVVVYGEIRTKAVMESAIRMGTTGHMVFGTLHTASGTGAVISISYELNIPASRLRDPHLLRGVIYQRLVQKTCPACGVGFEEAGKSISAYDRERIQNIFKDTSALKFIKKGGCDHCNKRGFIGRTVVAEVIPIDSPALDFIHKMDSHGWEKYIFEQKGWTNIKKHALEKIESGITDFFACEKQLGNLSVAGSTWEFNPDEIQKRLNYVNV